MRATTAILFFSRTARAEARHKQLFRDTARNQATLEALIARTRRVIQNSDLPVFWVKEDQQRGNSFGGRLYHAAQSVIERGYEQLIIVGNDSPQLAATDLTKAKKALDQGRAVIGANRRGGTYLIGVQARQLTAEFQALPWQTDRLADSLEAFLVDQQSALPLFTLNRRGGRQPKTVIHLRGLSDFNLATELAGLKMLSRGFRQLAAVFNVGVDILITEIQCFKSIYCQSLLRLRGPPIWA